MKTHFISQVLIKIKMILVIIFPKNSNVVFSRQLSLGLKQENHPQNLKKEIIFPGALSVDLSSDPSTYVTSQEWSAMCLEPQQCVG